MREQVILSTNYQGDIIPEQSPGVTFTEQQHTLNTVVDKSLSICYNVQLLWVHAWELARANRFSRMLEVI